MGGAVAEEPAAATAPRLRVFLSYSRKDLAFVRQLADALTARGYLADFDQSHHHSDTGDTGIAPTDDWWLRLQDMIAAADVMVLSVSPDSAASKVVDEEIAYARSLAKRVIAVTCRAVDFSTAPPRLSALNVNHWFLNGSFDQGIEELRVALDRDVEWLRASARYTVEAKAWEDADRAPDRLLFGQEISSAEAWSARRPSTAPEISDLVLNFLTASRTAQTEREVRERRSISRTRSLQRWTGVAVAAIFVITLIGSWFVIGRQRELSRSASLMLARVAQKALVDGDVHRGLQLAILGARNNFLSPSSPEAVAALVANGAAWRINAMTAGHAGGLTNIGFNPDGTRFVTANWVGHDITIWDTNTWKELSVLKGPERGVESIRFSSDGRRLIVVGSNGAGKVWDVKTGTEVAILPGMSGALLGTSLSLDGTVFATLDTDGICRFWDTRTGTQIALLGRSSDGKWSLPEPTKVTGPSELKNEPQPKENEDFVNGVVESEVLIIPEGAPNPFSVTAIAFSTDGARFAAGRSDGEIKLWNPAQRLELASLKGHTKEVNAVTFSPDGTHLATSDLIEGVRIWDAATGIQTAVFQAEQISYITFSPDGNRMLVGGAGVAYLLDAHTGASLAVINDINGRTEAAAFSPDGSRVVVKRAGGNPRVLDGRTGAVLDELKSKQIAATAIAFSPDGNQLVTADSGGSLVIWNGSAGAETTVMKGHEGPVRHLAFSQDGARLITVSDDGTSREWDTRSGAEVSSFRFLGSPRENAMAAISSDGSRAAWRVGSVGGYFSLRGGLDPQSAQNLKTLQGQEKPLSDVQFNNDGSLIATASEDGTVFLWDTTTGANVGKLQVSTSVMAIAFSSDGKQIAASTYNGTAVLWDVTSRARLMSERGMWGQSEDILFNPEGNVIASIRDVVQLWDVKTGTELDLLEIPGERITKALFSPDGLRIATASDDRMVRLWDVRTGDEIAKFEGFEGTVRGLAFSRDGTRLAASDDRTVRLWDMHWLRSPARADDYIAEICSAKLKGNETVVLTGQTRDGDASPSPEILEGSKNLRMSGIRRLDPQTIEMAPILRGREGEDVCATPTQQWYDGPLALLFGWALP